MKKVLVILCMSLVAIGSGQCAHALASRIHIGVVNPSYYTSTPYGSIGVLFPLHTRLSLALDMGYWNIRVKHTDYFSTRVIDIPIRVGMQIHYPFSHRIGVRFTGGFGIHFFRDSASFSGISSFAWRREPGLYVQTGLWYRLFERHEIGFSVRYELTHTFNQLYVLGGYIFRF